MTLHQIEAAISKLSLDDKRAVRDWLEEIIEDQLVLRDDFKVKINRAKREIADNNYSRVRKPEAKD